jgi:hypothetical protein
LREYVASLRAALQAEAGPLPEEQAHASASD